MAKDTDESVDTVVHGSAEAELTRTSGRKRTVVAHESESTPLSIKVPPAVPHAEVEVAIGETIGRPNYSSLRLDVKLRLPTAGNLESVNKTYAAALTWVRAKLEALKTEMEGGG